MYDISMFNYNTTDMVSTNITSTVLAAAMGQNFTGVSVSVIIHVHMYLMLYPVVKVIAV